MMNSIYTIGFTKKDAKTFFDLIRKNGIDIVVDVRLNNVSQLAGFSKFPDIEFFLDEICNCKYISDKLFSPEESTLKDYKTNKISWSMYVSQFSETLESRDIMNYILNNYKQIVENKKICFLCSEHTPENCHRRLIAEKFLEIFPGLNIVHLK